MVRRGARVYPQNGHETQHDEVDKINVSPVLIRKGDTKVALYGMGSMRDERLNRMWQGKKVKFLKVNSDKVNNSDDEDEEDSFVWMAVMLLKDCEKAWGSVGVTKKIFPVVS